MLGFPLAFHLLANAFKSHFDKIIIYNQFSPGELGVYTAGYQLAAIFYLFILSVNRALVPYMFSALKRKTLTYEILKKYLNIALTLFFIPSLIAHLIPEVFYSLIFGDGFFGSKGYAVLFLLGFGLSIPYLLLVNFLFYHGKNKGIAICTVVSTLIYLSLVYALSAVSINYIPLSLFLSNIVSVILLYRLAQKTMRETVSEQGTFFSIKNK